MEILTIILGLTTGSFSKSSLRKATQDIFPTHENRTISSPAKQTFHIRAPNRHCRGKIEK